MYDYRILNKNATKHQNGVPSPKNFHKPYIPTLPKFGKNFIDPPPRISNRVHLYVQCIIGRCFKIDITSIT